DCAGRPCAHGYPLVSGLLTPDWVPGPLLASLSMRQALASGAWLSAAAVALLAFALLGSQGSSTSRLFWIGLLAIAVVSVGLVLRPPDLSRAAVAFLGLLTAFAAWQALTRSEAGRVGNTCR